MRGKRIITMVIAFLILIALAALAVAELTADEIMNKVRESRYPETSKVVVKMTLRDAKGSALVKEFVMYRKVVGDDANTFIEFQNPPAIRGTRFMVIQKGEKEETYAKFTENPNVQRIGEGQRSDRFMGSDFTYGDLRIERRGDDKFELLGQQDFKGHPCYIIKSSPLNADKAQYSYLKIFVDREKFTVWFTEFFDKKKKEKFKELEVKEIKLIENKWTATLSVMTDLRDKHQTSMQLVEVKFRIPIADDMFSLRNLIRGL
jgi:hypothetical protein